MIAQLSSSLRASASWSGFREWLEYFAKVFGKIVVAVPPHYTSQNCSNCGTVVKKSLSVRTHCCPACKTVIDRDENAAINILIRAIEILEKNTVGHTEINAQGQFDLCLVGENLLGKPSGKTRKASAVSFSVRLSAHAEVRTGNN